TVPCVILTSLSFQSGCNLGTSMANRNTNQQNSYCRNLPVTFGPTECCSTTWCPDALVGPEFGHAWMQQSLGLRDLGGLGALCGTFLFQRLTRLLGYSLAGRFIRHRGPSILGACRSRFSE